ncbi:MAG: polymorphic toxin type 46 domain-containing protein [Minicystis sp.]
MSALEAARLGDQIGHTSALKGLLWGLVAGLVITGAVLLLAGATVATGGAAAVVFGALLAGTAAGGLAGINIGSKIPSDPKGPIITGSPNVFLGPSKMPAARATLDKVACADHSEKLIAQGSMDVFINLAPAARRTDKTVCDATIREGEPHVFFGGPTGTYLEIEAEIPPWVITVLEVAAIAGTIIATGGAVLTVGWGAALLGLGGSLLGGWGGGKLGAYIGGTLLGGGELGAAIGETAGGFIGSLVGGGLGARGGQALEARLPTEVLARMPGATPEHIQARMNVAREYYTNSPDFAPRSSSPTDVAAARARINDHMSGIDFTKPVTVRTIEEPTVFSQYQNAGARGPGNYIAEGGTPATKLGIGDLGRNYGTGEVGPKLVAQYEVPAGTRVLESTASPKNDFFAVGNGEAPGGGYYEPLMQPSTGGGTQMMIGNRGVMTQVEAPRPADPSLLQPSTPLDVVPGKVVPNQIQPPASPANVPIRGDGTFTAPSIPGTGVSTGVGAGTATGLSPPPGAPSGPLTPLPSAPVVPPPPGDGNP